MNPNYTIDCTGDVVVGDDIQFERATFSGSWRKPKFAGLETIEAKVINDSYGHHKQQHTFTLQLPDGSKLIIKGRNVYRNGCKRQAWPDELLRAKAQLEKHARGNSARNARDVRRQEEGYVYAY